MIKVVLIDDEPLARKGLRQMLTSYPQVQVVGEADSSKTALEVIAKEHPDVIFLDIQMPHEDGFHLLESLENPPKVIFITAHSQHAIKAFDVAAIDYLLKPVRPERLKKALQRVEGAVFNETKNISYKITDRIVLRTTKKTFIKPLESLTVFQADGDFTHIFATDSSSVMICQPLSFFETTLPKPPFLRLNRSLMININHIIRIERKSRDETVVTIQGAEAPFTLGRSGQRRLSKFLVS